MTRRRSSSVAAALVAATLGACGPTASPASDHQPVVDDLITLLEARPDLEVALTHAIDSSAVQGVGSLEGFYEYLDELVTWVPDERVVIPRVLNVHYIVNRAPADALNEDPAFSEWLSGVARAWGAFLDSPASAPGIASFVANPDYHVEDFAEGPSGWQTFNQFFARQMRPGKRPIAAPDDEGVIVSPADAIWMGSWPVNADATVTVKEADWSIAQLLDGSPYAAAFANGTYAHTFLRTTDYHRYHMPVGGVVREVRNVHGRVYIDVVKREDGSLGGANGDTYQFNQERGLVIVDSPEVGLVAIVPVGMSLISSVNLTPTEGAEVRKGEEFGFFAFGGSDIVLLFANPDVVLEAEAGTKYLQGQRIGHLARR